MNLYVGNISYQLSPDDLKEAFAPYGQVLNVRIITDKETGRSKGYAFLELESEEAVEKAIQALNGTQYRGRCIKVNHAHRKAALVDAE